MLAGSARVYPEDTEGWICLEQGKSNLNPQPGKGSSARVTEAEPHGANKGKMGGRLPREL